MKKLFVVGLALMVIGGGVWLGWGPYQGWKEKHYLAKGEAYAAKGDIRSAVSSLHKALDANSNNIVACRLMARITEQFRAPEAIFWRARVLNLAPTDAQNRLDLARTELLLNNSRDAAQVLQSVPPADRNRADFHELVALLDVSLNNPVEAGSEAATAVKLDPQNKNLQLNLDVLELQSKNKQQIQAARKNLEQLTADPALRRDALRQLAMAAVRESDYATAQMLAEKLLAEKPPLYDDQLLNLTILKDGKSGNFSAALANFEKLVSTNTAQINSLSGWLVGQHLADQSLQWLLALPEQTRQAPQVSAAIADCYAARQEWPKMQSLLTGGNWKDMEFIRLALLARAAKGQKDDATAKADWHTAVTSVSDRPQSLGGLARMAGAWGWESEGEEAAWLLVQKAPEEHWAVQMLDRQYTTNGNTRALQKLYSTLIKLSPNNVMYKNNFAAVSLLLGDQLLEAGEMARDDYEKYPQNPYFAATYAYALHVQSHTQEGLAILEKLPKDTLHSPGIAAYYGAMLAASGQPVKAREYLDIGARSSLLPEERALVAAARNATGGRVK